MTTTKPSLGLGRVALTTQDLQRLGDWYEQVVGLHLLERDGETARYGAGSEVLLELRQDKAARLRSSREAGLFHTAFLLPERADLGAWVRNAVEKRFPVAGASDHEVSEALYLSDPEGNGVEIYADRPAAAWRWRGGLVEMGTYGLDLQNLVESAEGRVWRGFSEGARIGHVHLQAGALSPAEEFYQDRLGLAVTNRYPGALFFAADGYHHHLAANIWNSRGAGPRSYPSTGLAEVEIRLAPERAAALREKTGAESGDFALEDPWGTRIALKAL